MRVIWIFFSVICMAVPSWGDESVLSLTAKADWSCADFHTTGVCRRNTPPFVGVKVAYWQPVLVVETVKRSGETGIVEFKSMVGPLASPSVVRLALSGIMDMPAGMDVSSGGESQADTTVLQMNEAHVFGFPFSAAFSLAVETPCEGPPDLVGAVSYLSEQDAAEWRTGEMEKKNPLAVMTERSAPMCDRFGLVLPGLCMGNWGSVYPRTGFSVHASEVVASAMTAFRAVDVASFKPQMPRRVIAPVLFWPSVRYDRMQLVSPVSRPCMAIGKDPGFWDQGVRSTDGRYVWIYWRKKECCLF